MAPNDVHSLRNGRGGISARRRGNRGMTLLEVVLALGILMVVLTTVLLLFMDVVRMNRTVAMQVTAGQSISGQLEELRSVAIDNATGHDGIMARALVAYYADTFSGENIAIGPNGTSIPRVELDAAGGRLIYRFWVANPGESRRFVAAGDRTFNPSKVGIGEMSVYIKETAMPPSSGSGAIWEDMAAGGTTVSSGFDINGDGTIADWAPPANLNTVKGDGFLKNIQQVPVDITITYFSDAKHQAQIYSVTRRMVMASIMDLAYLLDGKSGNTP